MSEITPVFEFNKKRYEVRITMKEAYGVLKTKFDLNIISMFASEAQMQAAMINLILDDEKTMQLMYFFIERATPAITFDDMVNLMEDLSILDSFRNAFWAAIVNFSSPLKKETLRGMWELLKKEMQDPDLAKRMLDESFLNGNAEPQEVKTNTH